MGMPQDILSPVPYIAEFREPRDKTKPALEAYERGGIALRDTQGKFNDFQNWTATCDGTDVTLTADDTLETEVIYSGTNITEIDLALDQTVNPSLALIEDEVCRFWVYDTTTQAYRTIDIPGGRTPRITLDDPQRRFSNDTDVLAFYIVGESLMMRKQRDRFDIEYELAVGIDSIVRVGMGLNRRLQFELGQPTQSQTSSLPDPLNAS